MKTSVSETLAQVFSRNFRKFFLAQVSSCIFCEIFKYIFLQSTSCDFFDLKSNRRRDQSHFIFSRKWNLNLSNIQNSVILTVVRKKDPTHGIIRLVGTYGCVSEVKKCQFYGTFCVHTKQINPFKFYRNKRLTFHFAHLYYSYRKLKLKILLICN